ncbi:MAG: hypothetical protein ACYS4W_09300 [Planctomycetota bacterium]|jgi:hypothetical protein
MNKLDKTFRDKLLETEKPNASYKEKYEKEVNAMVEKKLTLFGKVIYGLAGLIALLVGVWYGIAGILGLMGAPLLSRIVFIVIAIISLAFVGLAGWTVKSNTIRQRVHPAAIASMIWAFVVVMLVGLMSKGMRVEPIWAIQVVVYGIVFLMVASLLMVLTCIRQSELKTREKLLEIEYRLAELAEKIEGKPKN